MKKLSIDPANWDVPAAYRFMISAIVPRPIALVSTCNSKGIGNLAPFSYFNGVSTNPLCVMISIARRRDGSTKDTWINIQETGEFVVNTCGEWMADPVNQASADYPYGVDELEKVGFTGEASLKVRPQRVAEAAVQMECKLHQSVEVGGKHAGASILVIGQVVMVHVNPEIWKDGTVRLDGLKPISRLGGLSYGKNIETFDLPRPKV